ncbi:MAG: SCO family protein [Rhodobiaceae bacterium]|nr:SCO family protein [Rhodobiaceae bacterium]
MIKKLIFYGLFSLFIFASIYFFMNKDYYQNTTVQKIENQDALPGGHFTLKKQDGTIFDSKISNKLMLIYFGFTYCPDVCPTTLIKMADVIDRLGDDSDNVNSIFISIDPERDKEEVIKDYVSAFHDEIIGLTGSEEQISSVAKDWGVYYQKENIEGSDEYTVNHLDIIFLANANAEYVDFFPPKIQSALIVEKVRNIINNN